ncbi:DUF1294 domain-containing protein [Seinonella peptonophila]|nr:DUF1294 domain-containing protein [Seinonella peptonophila]
MLTSENFLLIYYIVMSLLGFSLIILDKRQAEKESWRISESALLITSLLGGGIGTIIGIALTRHRIQQIHFVIKILLTSLVTGAISYYLFSQQFVGKKLDWIHYLWILIPIFVYLTIHILSYCLRLYFFMQASRNMKRVRVVLPRTKEETSAEIIHFFDFLNNILLPTFSWQYYVFGARFFSWEIRMDQNGAKEIYLSAPSDLMDLIMKNLRTVYIHARFESVEDAVDERLPNQFRQLQFERHWSYSLRTIEVKDGKLEHKKNLADSLLQILDELEGEGGIQFILHPLSPDKQLDQQTRNRLSKIGGSIYDVEIRLFASNASLLQGMIATFGEVDVANNKIISEKLLRFKIREWFRNIWWSLVKLQAPSFLLGPKLRFASYQLALLLQFPTSNLRVRGISRFQHRRLPIPQGLPTGDEVNSPIAVTEEGVRVGLNDAMWGQNLLVVGTNGTGKTTTLGQHASHWLAREDEGALIISSQAHDLMNILQFVPDYKKVYIIDMDHPGEYGINFLANDEHPAEMMIEDFISIFDPPFAGKIKNMDFLQQALLGLRKVREVSPSWKKAVPAIDLRHIKEVLSNEKYRLHLIQALPKDSPIRRFWIERIQLMRNPRYYVTNIAPIINVFDRLLTVDRVAKTLCHPRTIHLKKALLEEKAVVAFQCGRWDYGIDVSEFAGNMLITLLYHSILHQRELEPEDRVNINLILDDAGGYATRVMMMLMVRAWKINVKAALAVHSWFDLPEGMRIFLNIVFPNKMIFRSHHQEDAEHWSNWLDLLDADDFLHFKHHYACLWLKADSEQKDPFIVRALYEQEKARWGKFHFDRSWPKTEQPVKLNPILLPNLGDIDESNMYSPPLKK